MDLKNDILILVSTLRKEFSELKVQLENVNHENKNLKEEVKDATKEAATKRDSHTARQVAPSLDHRQQPEREVWQVLPPQGRRRKLYADAGKTQEEKRFRITLKAKDETTTPEQIKQQLKMNISPTDIRVGTKAVKQSEKMVY